MGFNSAFKGLKLLKKNPGNGRLNNLNDPVLNVLMILKTFCKICPRHLRFPCGQDSFSDLYMKIYIFLFTNDYFLPCALHAHSCAQDSWYIIRI